MSLSNNGGSCLAIDFGTTATAAAISSRGREQLVEIDGSPRMPSIVCWKAPENGGEGRLLLGEAAENEAALAPHCVERCPKRKLGQELMLLGEARIRVTDAVAQIFVQVIAEATALEGGRVPSELRLTHPAQWGQPKLAKLREAAAGAGFTAVELLPEPVGAAVYFAGQALRTGQHVAVYDLGGGTFDTAVLLRTGENFEVIGRPGGRDDLGGEDFDDRLYRFLSGQLDPDQRTTLTAPDADLRWQRAHHDFRREVRRAKERLSKYADATVRNPIAGEPDLRVSRTEFEGLIRTDVAGTIDELERTIAASGQPADTLSAIYLAGGSSRIPLVATLIEERFGRAPRVLGDPKAVIALGAARAHAQRGTTRAASLDEPAPAAPLPVSSPATVDPAPVEQIVVRAAPPARPPARPPAPAAKPAAPVARAPRTVSKPPLRRDMTAASVTGVSAGGAVLATVASALLLLAAAHSGAAAGIRVATGLGLVGWLVVAGGFATACSAFLGLVRDRLAGLRAAAGVISAGFGLGFLSEMVNAVAYGTHGARGTFVGAHAAFGFCDLLAAIAAALAAAALAGGSRPTARRMDALLSWACAAVGASLLGFSVSSILYLVTYEAGAARAAVTGGVGAQIAGSALAAGGALIAATAFLLARGEATTWSHRRQVLAVGAGAAAVGLGIVGLGSGMQAAVAATTGPGVRTVVAGWLLTGQQLCWAVALCWASLGSARRI